MKRFAILLLLLSGLLLTCGCAFDSEIERRNAWLNATGGTYDGDTVPAR